MEIVLDHVSKKIKNNLVLDNLNQTFKSGYIYGLKGYNGSGKTMLLMYLLTAGCLGRTWITRLQLECLLKIRRFLKISVLLKI